MGGWYGLKKGLRGRFGVYLPPVLEALGSTVVVVALVEVAVSSPVLPVLEPEVVGVPLDAVSLPLPSLSVALPLPLLPVGEAVGSTVVSEVFVIVVDALSTAFPSSPQAVDKKEIVRIREADAIRIARR